MFDFNLNDMSLEWKSQYDTGIDVIDLEHQDLLAAIGNLNTVLDKAETDFNPIISLINDLRTLALGHFATEEKLMADAQYPQLLEHTNLHNTLIEKLDKLIADISSTSWEYLKLELTDYLKSWLVFHILGADQGYIADVKQITSSSEV